MSHGRLTAIVGPSGVGKDTILRGMAERAPGLTLVRRVITRAPGLDEEDHEAVSEQEFERRIAAEGFCLRWQAHGLRYGIPMDVLAKTTAGIDHIVNLSRAVLVEAHKVFPSLVVINLTTAPETLALRLNRRGRESAEDIAKRISRRVSAFDERLTVFTISNDGAPEDTIRRALAVVQPPKSAPGHNMMT